MKLEFKLIRSVTVRILGTGKGLYPCVKSTVTNETRSHRLNHCLPFSSFFCL